MFKNGKNRVVLVMIAAILIALTLISVGLWYGGGREASRQVRLGQKYLDEMEYEQAIAAFWQALKIDPQNVDAYLGLAEAYIETDDIESAMEILEEGYALVQDERLVEKIGETRNRSPMPNVSSDRLVDKNTEINNMNRDTDIETDNTDRDTVFLLEHYAQQEKYLYGKDYNGYIQKGDDWTYDPDYSEIPVQNIAYQIADYDKDNEQELLIIGLTESYYLNLRMYETDNDEILLSDEIDLEMNLIRDDFSVLLTVCGNIRCYTYGTNEICIGIEKQATMKFLGDGTGIAFLSLSYDGNDFHQNGYASYVGSDGMLDETYMDTLSELDIHVSWDDLLFGRKTVRDCVEDVEMIIDIKTVYTVEAEEVYQWWADDLADKLQISHIYFGDIADSESP